MSFSVVHISDPHFGAEADLPKIQNLESLIPDLEPSVIVLSGDLTLRARHGEFMAAHAFVRELERTAPVLVIPGNHDVQWWWRPLIPFSSAVKYSKYRRYFGPQLSPTLDLADAIVVSALTSHGVAWGSLTLRPKDISIKGHLRAKEISKVKEVFNKARPEQTRILVLHHNVLRGELSNRMGLARWRRAQRRIIDSGADIVLCGHDHQEKAELLDGVVISCVGTLSIRTRGDLTSAFHRISLGEDAVQVDVYKWESDNRLFRRSDSNYFARKRMTSDAELATGVV
jgi:3',5'-cyclic AMP phosphodiesterase CpdA